MVVRPRATKAVGTELALLAVVVVAAAAVELEEASLTMMIILGVRTFLLNSTYQLNNRL
jgi:hypothetical protein